MKKIILALTLAFALAFPLLVTAEWDTTQAGQLAFQKDGKDVWRFHYGSEAVKPHFHPVCVVGGPSLTMIPEDHIWHRGFWFAWYRINGVDYWKETDGKTVGEQTWKAPSITTRDDGSATIVMDLSFGTEMLTEQRTIEISAPNAKGEYCMDWTLQFTAHHDLTFTRVPILGDTNGTIKGGYAGLSVRFAEAFTNVETHAASVKGRFVQDAVHFTPPPCPAFGQSGLIDGKACGIAILSHPSNPRGPGDWYMIEDGGRWNFINAAYLLLSPYSMKTGETLTLRYRVWVHEGRWDDARLREAFAEYAPIRVLIVEPRIRVRQNIRCAILHILYSCQKDTQQSNNKGYF
jgi:hypothetical protein